MGGNIRNTDLQHDSNKVKDCSKCGYPCTARLNSLNRDILRHNKGTWWNTYQYLYRHHFGPHLTWQLVFGKSTGLPARAYSLYTAPGMHHIMKLRYGVDNPGEVGFTAVYLPSWICVNSVHVCKVANATLQFPDYCLWAMIFKTEK